MGDKVSKRKQKVAAKKAAADKAQYVVDVKNDFESKQQQAAQNQLDQTSLDNATKAFNVIWPLRRGEVSDYPPPQPGEVSYHPPLPPEQTNGGASTDAFAQNNVAVENAASGQVAGEDAKKTLTSADAFEANNALKSASNTMLGNLPNSIAPQQTLNTQATLSPWEALMKERREALKQEKTDAQKMQRYYALADALKSLGHMGGAAIGGAIGGDALAGATAPEYKASRGYIDAFEKAKEANEALRKLDDTEFQLKYADQKAEVDRKYNEKKEQISRQFQAEQARLTREFQASESALNRKWQEAMQTNNLEAKAAIERDLLNLKQTFQAQLQASQQAHEKAIKEASERIVAMQTGKIFPFSFDNGTSIELTNTDYEGLKRKYMNKTVNGRKVTKDNFDAVIASDPDLVNSYMKSIGKEAKFIAGQPVSNTTNTSTSTPATPAGQYGYGFPMWFNPYGFADDTVELTDEQAEAYKRN